MEKKFHTLVDNLTFPEGPRWKKDRLYFSDFFTHKVISVDLDGNSETVATVPNQPSGLGWLPDGTLLIVSMIDQKLLALKNDALEEVADCSELATFYCNDMIVNKNGNAYIGNFGFNTHANEDPKSTNLILVRPGEEPVIAADNLFFPNGTVISEDSKTLVIGESYAARLTAFDINDDGSLSNRRIWADLSQIKEGYRPVPDGICMDEEGAIWLASPSTSEVLRVKEGAILLDTLPVETNAYACVLGGEDRKTLFVCTSGGSDKNSCIKNREGKIEIIDVDIPGTGIP